MAVLPLSKDSGRLFFSVFTAVYAAVYAAACPAAAQAVPGREPLRICGHVLMRAADMAYCQPPARIIAGVPGRQGSTCNMGIVIVYYLVERALLF
jgi:hypothetical protein